MEDTGDILVLPFFGQGHLNPCVELCRYLSSYTEAKLFLIIPSHLSSSIPSGLQQHHPSIEVLRIEIPNTQPPPPVEGGGNIPGHGHNRDQYQQPLLQGVESFLAERYNNANVAGKTRPGCVVIDSMMSWCKDIFLREDIPIFSFSTSGAVSTAMEYAVWKAQADDMKPGETRLLAGLPESMALRYSDTRRRFHRGGPPGASESDHRYPWWRNGFGHREPGQSPRYLEEGDDMKPGETLLPTGLPESVALKYSASIRPNHRGPPGVSESDHRGPWPLGRNGFGHREPGQAPRWLEEGGDFKALLINTCHDLEGPFLDYLATQLETPVFGVGPLLPETYWRSTGTFYRDRDSRSSNRKSNHTEDEIVQWLDSKPSQSVIYVSFGSEVGPNMEEYGELADALEESRWAFIWVIQPGSGKHPRPPPFQSCDDNDEDEGYKPIGLQEKVGKRGMIIMGWAPQLLILSHPSTGGFLSHCGWNSNMEAVGRGVPILAWPIRGDQFYIAKLVVDYLKIGVMVTRGDELVKKSEILEGIDMVMDDQETHETTKNLSRMFEAGFPSTSTASMKALLQLLSSN